MLSIGSHIRINSARHGIPGKYGDGWFAKEAEHSTYNNNPNAQSEGPVLPE